MPTKIENRTSRRRERRRAFQRRESTLGRTPSEDGRLDPQEDAGSARKVHAQIVRSKNGLSLYVIHRSGVVVRQPAKETIRLQPGECLRVTGPTDFTLGDHGPSIRVIDQCDDDFPATRSPVAPVGQPTDVVVKQRIPNVIKRRPTSMAVLTMLVLFGATSAVLSLGLRDVNARIDEASMRESRIAFDAAKGALAHDVVTHRSSDPLVRNLTAAAGSVFLVAMVGDDGGISEIGTAWAVADGRLATNAHVALAVDEALEMEGIKVIARRTQKPERDLEVTGSQVHPGYVRWTQILSNRLPKKGALSIEPFNVAGACDVALLEVDGDVGEPLQLATSDELSRLAPGDTIGYVGFPAENVSGLREYAPPAMLVGHIIGLSSPLFSATSGEEAFLIHHDLVSTGGASGSPILDGRGRVIGMVNAGSIVPVMSLSGSPTRIATGFNYGQRIDLLTEMLDGAAEENQLSRDVQWFEELRKITVSAEDMMSEVLRRSLENLIVMGDINSAGSQTVILEHDAPIPAESGDGTTIDIEFESGRMYGIVSYSDDWTDIDLELLVDGEVVAADHAGDNFPLIWYSAPEGATVTIRLFAASESNFPDALAHIRVVTLD